MCFGSDLTSLFALATRKLRAQSETCGITGYKIKVTFPQFCLLFDLTNLDLRAFFGYLESFRDELG